MRQPINVYYTYRMLSALLYDHFGEFAFLAHLPFHTLEYYVTMHGRQKSLWADVWFSNSLEKSIHGAFILVKIPKDLKCTYSLMPLCNSQERIQVLGTTRVVKKFICR